VDPRAGLDDLERRKIPALCRKSKIARPRDMELQKTKPLECTFKDKRSDKCYQPEKKIKNSLYYL
jgi:hypothetical protein